MARIIRVLGQSNPAATTLTPVYTVPALTSAMISSILVANRSATATSFRISVAVAGVADGLEQYLAYDVLISGNESKDFTLGVGVGATDAVRVYATLATLSFSVFGVEYT